MELEDLKRIYESEKERYIEELKEFLAFQSVSANPDQREDCLQCAEWTRAHLEKIGFRTEMLETTTLPVVFGEYVPKESKGTLSFYGHYDVQPVDPIELWESPPFEPEIRDGRLYARGAQDNKGQVFFVLKALEALIRENALNYTVKIFIEGEEEVQSIGIAEALPSWKEKLASDALLVCDTGTPSPETLCLTLGLRGVAAVNVKLIGPSKDLHSGVHGGVAPNPAAGMCKLIASLHNDDGSIAVDGFYEDIVPVSDEDKELATKAEIPADVYKQKIGTLPVGGERELPFAIRRGLRPTLEINGVHSGYGGPGSKTIIPSESIARITCRTLVGQDGKKLLDCIEKHLREHTPAGLTLEVSDKRAEGAALSVSASSPTVLRARKALEDMNEGPVLCLWEGASIPIVADLALTAEAEPVLVGFGLEEDNIHAPNESFSLDQFRKGFLFAGLFFA